MRRTASFAALGALALLLPAAGCVPNSEVPSVVAVPTSPSSSAAQPLTATPQALTTSVSASPPYASVSVAQPGAASLPFLIAAQSTCLENGYALLVSTTQNGASTVVEIQPIHAGTCVLEFGGAAGATLIVPVTITP